MLESDIRSNINAECETPMCQGTECEMHHPECTCDACCQLTGSICEDNRDQCDKTHQPSGGKKMKRKLMPILANAIVLPAVLSISGLTGHAQKLDRSANLDNIAVEHVIHDVHGSDVIQHADHTQLIGDFDIA